MKKINLKIIAILLVVFGGSTLFPKAVWAIYESVTTSPYVTIYDPSNGEIDHGPHLKDTDKIVRISYQGSNIRDDSTITSVSGVERNITTTVYDSVHKGEVFRTKNVGTLNGKPLVFAMKPVNIGMIFYFSGNLAKNGINPYVYGLEGDLEIWVEDVDKNIITDPDILFLLSYATQHAYTGSFEKIGFRNDTEEPYFIAPSTTAKMQVDKADMGSGIYDFLIKTDPLAGVVRPYSYGFKQSTGSKTYFSRETGPAGTVNALSSSIFLSPDNTAGIKIPYEEPFITSTEVDKPLDVNNWHKAELKVTQQLIKQSFDSQYPEPLEIIIDPGEFGNTDGISASDISITSTKTGNIINSSQYTVETPASGINAGKLVIKLPRTLLKSIGDDEITINGWLPFDLENDDIYKSLTSDGFITMFDVTAKNNENPRETSADLKVRVAAPTGDPVPVTVMEGTDSAILNPSDLVKNLNSVIPGDVVTVEGFKAPKDFNTVGDTSIIVIIKSTITGFTREITVPVKVLSKSLFILEPIKIIPELGKVASNKTELTYNPNFEQVFKAPGGTTQIDKVKLTGTYSEFLSVSPADFEIFVGTDTNPLPSTDYTLQLDTSKNEFYVNFTNSIVNSKLLGKTVTVKQRSSVITNDADIMNLYNQTTRKFTFPITAYYSFGEIGQTWTVTQNPISTDEQIITYEPTITANSVPEETVLVGATVKDAKDYVKDVSKPDFDFDNYSIDFETKPDFSTAGEKKFNIVITSDEFGNSIKVPVVVQVREPTVKMSIKQVYGEKNSMPIYSDLAAETPVNNNSNVYDVDIDDNLTAVLDNIVATDAANFKLNYDGYSTITTAKYKVLVDGVETSTDKVPNKDFVLLLEYDGLINVTAHDLNYGTISTTSKRSVHKIDAADIKDVTVVNTTLNPNWTLSVSLDNDIKKGTDVYLGGLQFEKDSDPNPVYIDNDGVEFATQTVSDKKLQTKLPMNIDLYQNVGNKVGAYEGTVVWTLEDTI